MSIHAKLKPARQNHSIKEASISVFLQNPIVNPKDFGTLIETDFKGKFQRFEVQDHVSVSLNVGSGRNIATQTEIEEDKGFQFTSFDAKGRTEKIIRGCNELDRTYVSYHSLNYERWLPFMDSYKENMSVISRQQDLFTIAFGLHYLDEFYWTEKNTDIEPRMIFNNTNDYLPAHFFNSSNTIFVMVTENEDCIDRLEIKITSKLSIPIVSISHNVIASQDQAKKLNELIDSSDFSEALNLAHERNKNLLKQILQPSISELIKLT